MIYPEVNHSNYDGVTCKPCDIGESQAIHAPQAEAHNIESQTNDSVKRLGDKEDFAVTFSKHHKRETPWRGSQHCAYYSPRDIGQYYKKLLAIE